MPFSSLALSLENTGVYYWRYESYLRRTKFWAIENVSFHLYQGESLGIIGRNGAGKSTLLQLLAGVLKPDRGVLVNHGVTLTLLSLQLGFIPYLTGRQNAYLSGMYLGFSKAFVDSCIEKIKDFSELGDFFEQAINTYSAGMRARLGFSIAFQVNPDVLLVDEVLGVGDAEFRQKSSAVMKERIRSDKTIVLVSHNSETIRQLCSRVVWIENGRTVDEGEPNAVLSDYDKHIKNKLLQGH